MKDCDTLRRLVSPYLDDELVAEERADFETHVRDCVGCRDVLEQECAVLRAIGAALPLNETPGELRTRVHALLAGSREPVSPAAVPPRRALGPWLVLAASLVACVLAGLALLRAPAHEAEKAQGRLAALAVDTHLRHARGQLPLEVRSESAAAVAQFFEGRVPFHLTLPDYPLGPGESKPYHLEGGRLVAFGGDYAAYVAYRLDERPISLLVTSAESVRPEGGEAVSSGGLTFHIESVAGLKVITWSDKGLTYALASDLTATGSRAWSATARPRSVASSRDCEGACMLAFLTVALLLAGDVPRELPSDAAPGYRLLRPDLAVSGAPSAHTVARLKELGFRTVVDLRGEAEQPQAERAAVEAQGLRYVSVPVSAETFTLADALAVGRVLDDPNAGPVLLHCASSNRVGAVWAVLQARAGKPHDQALAAGREAGLKSDAMLAAVERVLAQQDGAPRP